MPRLVPLLATALALGLTACQDARRDAVSDYLKLHPPENFTLVEIPDKIIVTGANESVVRVKYRLTRPTVQVIDALTQPRAVEYLQRINAIRGWALSSLTASDPTRAEITAASAGARVPIPVKRIVTPAGTEVETLAVLKLAKNADGWQITPESLDVHVPGQPDNNRAIPLQNSPEVAAKLDKLAALAKHLEDARQKHLESRRVASERSLATLRSLLRAGNTFEGELTGGATVRLIITRGIDTNETANAVLAVQRGMQSSARFTGALARQPSGDYIWRAAQVTTLSDSGGDPLTDSRRHPIISLTPGSKGLTLQFEATGIPRRSLPLQETAKADLIPETPAQGVEQ